MGGDEFSNGTFDDPKHKVNGPGVTRTMYSAVSLSGQLIRFYRTVIDAQMMAVAEGDVRALGIIPYQYNSVATY